MSRHPPKRKPKRDHSPLARHARAEAARIAKALGDRATVTITRDNKLQIKPKDPIK